MRNDDARLVMQGMDDMRQALLRRKMLKQQEADRAQATTRYEEEKTYARGRDAAGDQRTDRDYYARMEAATLARQRQSEQDALALGNREVDNMNREADRGYQRERDGVGDQRWDAERLQKMQQTFEDNRLRQMELKIRQEAAQNRNSGGYVTEQLDPETGEVIAQTRRTPMTVAPAANSPGAGIPQRVPINAGDDGIPVLTPEQARAAKPGTKFKTADGRVLIR